VGGHEHDEHVSKVKLAATQLACEQLLELALDALAACVLEHVPGPVHGDLQHLEPGQAEPFVVRADNGDRIPADASNVSKLLVCGRQYWFSLSEVRPSMLLSGNVRAR
jgi:hypothetical protein